MFSNRCGRLRLSNVAVVNAGVAWGVADNVFWRHQVRSPTVHTSSWSPVNSPFPLSSSSICMPQQHQAENTRLNSTAGVQRLVHEALCMRRSCNDWPAMRNEHPLMAGIWGGM